MMIPTAAGAAGDRPAPPGVKLSPLAQAEAGVGPAAIIPPANTAALAAAMDVPAGDLVAADVMGSDPAGFGIGDAPLGHHFPSRGSTFAVLSTGFASNADTPNDSDSLSGVLGGLDNSQGNDLVRLHLQLTVPTGATCANFDFGYYSEEFPEWVGSEYNDTFTAQLNDSTLTIVGNDVTAPGNFAFDTAGNIISVNTVFGVSEGTGTTYDGATPRIQAAVGVTPGATAHIYLSVQDLGDSIYDSAVFLDNFFWSSGTDCSSGADADTDGDGLLDAWEKNGLTVGGQFVDLPAMGADAMHKDIFVEVDWMATGTHSHRPDPAAIAAIVQSFDNAPVSNPDGRTGIHLHVDYGPTSPLTWRSGTWGGLSRGTQLAETTPLGSGSPYNWGAFDTIKNANFNVGRRAVFHYNVWAHNYGSTTSSGISRGIEASDLIVSLGSFPGQVGTVAQQAGTFMHELGHNLGLWHGGFENVNFKPNYRSVMNYAFQFWGLPAGGSVGHYDYSRSALPTLNESSLNEPSGIGTTSAFGTFYYCAGAGTWDFAGDLVDWNCDGDVTDTGVAGNVNNEGGLTTLAGYNDWSNIVYTGGLIGSAGADIDLPDTSPVEENTVALFESLPNPLAESNTLTVTKTGAGSGTVTGIGIDCGTDCTHDYMPGASVELTATPASGSLVGTWTGCTTAAGATCTVEMSADRAVSVSFTLEPTFADVPTTNPFYSYIEELYTRGITTGCGTNGAGQLIFCPGEFVPRQQMAAFLIRAKNLTELHSASPTFADVDESNPFYGYIERLYQTGITTGCGTNGAGELIFCPGEFVPRQQMAAFLMRAKGMSQLNSDTPTFADVPKTNPFYGWIERLYQQGVTTGCGTNGSGQLIYCPGEFVPRQQMAAFLIRAFPS